MDSNGNMHTTIFQRSSQANESQENSAEPSPVVYPYLGHETPLFQWQNFLEASFYNFQEDVNYPPSLTILSQGKNKGLIGDNIASSNSTSSIQGHNPRGQENNASRGKGKEPMEEWVRVPREETNETFCHRSSMYQGVTRYGNNISEAFQWDNIHTKKPKTGEFNSEEEAAQAHYLAALKYWGECIARYSHPSNDEDELKELTRNEYLNSFKRKSNGISKGTSKYRGVCKNSDKKKWQARLGRGRGLRSIYLGSFSSEEEAARAYDIAAIRLKGFNAITNFDLSQYNVGSILESEKFPIGNGVSRMVKNATVEDFLRKRRDARLRISTSRNENSSIFRPVNNPQIQMIPVPTPNPSTKLSHKNSINQVLHLNPSSSPKSNETQNGPMFQRNPNWFHGSSSCMGNGILETDHQENSLGRFCTGRQAVPRFEQQSPSSFYPVGYQSPSHIHSNPTTFFNGEVEGVDDFLDGSCNDYQNPSCCSFGNKEGFIENNEDGADWDLDIDIENVDIDPNFLRDFFSDEP